MATDLEKLIVSLEARTNAFEKAMNKAVGHTNNTAKKIERRWAGINFGKDVFSPLVRGAALALAPILSVAAAIRGAKDAMAEFDSIAKQAKSAGIDAEAFQEYAYAAELGGVATAEFAKALEQFAKNAGLAAVGKGRMVSQLQQLNPELLKNLQLATSQEERLRLVADALDEEADASRKAAIASVAFGDSGARMVEVLKGGSAALDDTARRARELGLVVDRELLAKAEELNDDFETATRVIDLQFKQALINLAPILVSTAQLAGDVARAIGDIISSMQGVEAQSTRLLETRLRGLRAELSTMTTTRPAGVVTAMDPETSPEAIAAIEAEIAAIEAELANRGPIEVPIVPVGPDPEDTADALRYFESTRTAAERYSTEVARLDELLASGAITQDVYNRAVADAQSTLDSSSKSRNTAAASAIKQAEATQDLIADLRFEQEQIGRTAVEQEVMNNLRRAGVDIMSEEGRQIADLTRANASLQETMERNAQAFEDWRDIGLDAVGSLVAALDDGKIEAEEFGDILISAAAALANLYLPGSGQVVSALGGLFKGKRAMGGPVSPGGAYMVGERGPELFAPRVPGTIVPNNRLGGGQSTVRIELVDDMLNARIVEQSGPVAVRVSSAQVARYDSGLQNRMAEKQARYF